jgi:hypothetical protein
MHRASYWHFSILGASGGLHNAHRPKFHRINPSQTHQRNNGKRQTFPQLRGKPSRRHHHLLRKQHGSCCSQQRVLFKGTKSPKSSRGFFPVRESLSFSIIYIHAQKYTMSYVGIQSKNCLKWPFQSSSLPLSSGHPPKNNTPKTQPA